MPVETTILSDATTFTTLQAEWLDLLSRSVTNYVFQTPQFQGAWWQTLGEGKLCIVTVRDEGKLIGLAPLYLEKYTQQLCFIGCVNVSDYLDVIVDKDHQKVVYDALGKTLKKDLTEWDKIFLCSLPQATPTRQWLKRLFPSATETQQDISPYITLPSNWETYLDSINRKQRHELRRKMRRLDEVEHSFELITAEKDAQTALKDFIKLHKVSSAEKRDFWDDKHLKFFNTFVPQASAANWLKLYFLDIGTTRAAAMLILDYNNQFLLYNSGFDPTQFKQLSPGNMLTAYTIKQAIDQAKTVYDFLRGDEEYKFRFGAVANPVFDIAVPSKL